MNTAVAALANFVDVDIRDVYVLDALRDLMHELESAAPSVDWAALSAQLKRSSAAGHRAARRLLVMNGHTVEQATEMLTRLS